MSATDPSGYDGPALERLVVEPPKGADIPRAPFERDRARVLHSSALRRLAAKTQVVGVGDDDFPRTRLTHSLECAQIGRELASALGADPDLVDAACLAHDLGHPPFGHNGETALDVAAQACGGFEGNAQSFRLLTRLEVKVLDADGRSAGLNLTRAALDAASKYPWSREVDGRKYGAYADDADVLRWVRQGSAEGARCVEAQVMDWADDVAYSVHDLEDAVHTGALDPERIDDRAVVERAALDYSPDEPEELAAALDGLRAQPWWPRRHDGSIRAKAELKRTTSELIARFCAAARAATRAAHGSGALRRHAGALEVPAATRRECALLKAATAVYVMDRDEALRRQAGERDLLLALVAVLSERPEELERDHAERHAAATDDAGRLRAVVDQVAALTDHSARSWAARLC